MPSVSPHENKVFEDQTIYLTGNAYIDCTFRRCTLVFVGKGASVIRGGHMENCVFHLNMVIHDTETLQEATMILGFAKQALPKDGTPPQPDSQEK